MSNLLPKLITAEECDAAELDSFLRTYFTPEKCAFLRDFGAWQHRGNNNRFVIVKDGRIAAYCAVMPTEICVEAEVFPAYWWIDLYIHPDFRGQGLQRLFDEKVKAMGLILGVPNENAAKIHRKHSWGVREDFSVMLLPLQPSQMPAIQRQKPLFRYTAYFLEPFSRLWWKLLSSRKSSAFEITEAKAAQLAQVHARYWEQTSTERNTDYLQWRFFDSPYQNEYRYWGIKDGNDLELVLISRLVDSSLRILDVFGNLANRVLLSQLVLKVIQAHFNIVQVTAVACNPLLKEALQALGFLPLGKFRFCWISENKHLMQQLSQTEFHWSLADSDSDLT